MSNNRYRTKPVETAYVTAIFDKTGNQYIVQQLTKDGKVDSDRAIQFLTKDEFEARYDSMERKPRKASMSVTLPANGGAKKPEHHGSKA